MALNFFDQFNSPQFLLLPLFLVALIIPWLFYPSPSSHLMKNRFTNTQMLVINYNSKQLFNSITSKSHSWILMFMSLMTFLITMNLFGLLPYTFTPTTQLSLSLAFALPLWLMTVFLGLYKHFTAFVGHLLPQGTPTILIPPLSIIETLSLLIRPMALGVRLTANLTAGHLLIQLISSGTLFLTSFLPPVSILMISVLMLLTLLEIAVAVIQAYVFILLLSLYLQEALSH